MYLNMYINVYCDGHDAFITISDIPDFFDFYLFIYLKLINLCIVVIFGSAN